MLSKNIVITGGTNGIGLAIVKKLIQLDYNIFVIGKDEKKGNKLVNSINYSKLDFFKCDLSEKNEITYLIKKLKKIKKIDVLINNAGALYEKRLINDNNVEKTFSLNHLSYFHLSLGILENLEQSISSGGGRIINVASDAHKIFNLDLNDLENKINYNGWKAYCRSKLLNLYFTYSFNKELTTKVTCNCLHPGFINSNFGNNNSSITRSLIKILKNIFAKSPEEGSITTVYLATSENLKNITGKYFFNLKEKKSSKQSYNLKIAKEVWRKSLNYIK